jgi:hypothetical protein
MGQYTRVRPTIPSIYRRGTMSNTFELTKKQEKMLTDNKWNPNKYGGMIVLNKSDFKNDWNEVCSNFNLADDCKRATLFVVGVAQEKEYDVE